jgi:hypothetical protein
MTTTRTTKKPARKPAAKAPKRDDHAPKKASTKPASDKHAKGARASKKAVQPQPDAAPAPAEKVADVVAQPAAPVETKLTMDDLQKLTDAAEGTGEAVSGVHLARCVRYVLKVVPKEGGELVFTHDHEGRAIISGHNQRASHTGYLVAEAAMNCNVSVPRDEAAAFAKLLEGLTNPVVRINVSGCATVHHDPAQPSVRFNLGTRPIITRWRPPAQDDRPQSLGPLRIPAAVQSAAVKWPDAVMQSWQSRDGIEWITVTDAESGELLAKAVIAQEGRDLYPEDERQTEIPGSRTAGRDAEVLKSIRDLRNSLVESGTTMRIEAGGQSVTLGVDPRQAPMFPEAPAPAEGDVTIEAGGETVVIPADAPLEPAPVAAVEATEAALVEEPPVEVDASAPAFPEVAQGLVVVEIPEVIWDGLSPDAVAELSNPPGANVRVQWFTGAETAASASVSIDTLAAITQVLGALGLRCAHHEAGRRYGYEVTVMTIGRAPAQLRAVG